MASLTEYLEPTPVRTGTRIPFDSVARSYHLVRKYVGWAGFALPVALLLGDWWFLDEGWKARGSLSAYYHSGMRDVFVCILVIVGILLVTYRATERDRDSAFSTVAGFAAVVVALVPTGIPSGVDVGLTPLQREIGEAWAQRIHFTAAGTFVLFLLMLSYAFARREREQTQERDGYRAKRTPAFWYRFHLSMAALIGLGVALIPFLKLIDFFENQSILIGETVVVVAFGLSWWAKGLEPTAPKPANAIESAT